MGRVGGLLLALLGLPFMLGGGYFGLSAAKHLMLLRAAAGWPTAPARVISADLESSSDSEGGTTYKAVCVYEYTINGQSHTGTRIGVWGGGDNIGDWQQSTYRRLRGALESGLPVPCFVDPANPSRALLDRDLRTGLVAFQLLFLFLFGGAGAAIFLAGGSKLLAGAGAAESAFSLPASDPEEEDPLGAKEVDLGNGSWAIRAADSDPPPRAGRLEWDERGSCLTLARAHGGVHLGCASVIAATLFAGIIFVAAREGPSAPLVIGALIMAVVLSGVVAGCVQHLGWYGFAARGGSLVLRRRIGPFRWGGELRMDDVDTILVAQCSRFNETRTYAVKAKLRNGKSVTLANAVPDMASAFWFALRARTEIFGPAE